MTNRPTRSSQESSKEKLPEKSRILTKKQVEKVDSIARQVENVDKRLNRIEIQMKSMEMRILQEFKVITEHYFHELKGSTKDTIEVVKDRVTRLEEAVGIR